jgi:DNA-binding MarR family transcriptional regulator
MDTRGVVGQIARIREGTHLLIEQELRARGVVGIVPAHGDVLAFLFRQTEPVPIKTVVEHVGRVKSTVSGMLNTLENYGYVRRFRSTSDQRVVYVALTDKGRGLRGDFDAISKKLLACFYGTMPQKQRKALVDLLATVERNLQTTSK